MFSVKPTEAGATPGNPPKAAALPALQLTALHVAFEKLAYRYSTFAVQLSVMAYSMPAPAVQPGSVPPPKDRAPVDGLMSVEAPPAVAYNSVLSAEKPPRR